MKLYNYENVSRSTVIRLKKKELLQNGIKDLHISGRPRLFSVRTERKFVRLMVSGKHTTAKALTSYLNKEENTNVSAETVRRIFKRAGYVARIKRRKFLLKVIHKKKRLEFAKKYKNWNIENWNRIIWSDECKIELFGNNNREWCWKKPNSPLDSKSITHNCTILFKKVFINFCKKVY